MTDDATERWRGRVDEAIATLKRENEEQVRWRSEHERQMAKDAEASRQRFDAVHTRITRLEVRVAFYAGIASLLGSISGMLLGNLLSSFAR